MAKFKAIKPKPFKGTEAANKLLRSNADKVAGYIKEDFEKVTDGWTGARPTWNTRITINQHAVTITAYLANPNSKGGQKWVWLDEGTKPHTIQPKKPGGVLAFAVGGSAGSKPNSLRTFAPKAGSTPVFAKAVQHPGNEARNWTVMLQKQEEPMFAKWMDPIMKQIARESGHAVK